MVQTFDVSRLYLSLIALVLLTYVASVVLCCVDKALLLRRTKFPVLSVRHYKSCIPKISIAPSEIRVQLLVWFKKIY